MKRLFYRNPLLAIAIFAILLIYNYYNERKDNKKLSALSVSLDEKRGRVCVSKPPPPLTDHRDGQQYRTVEIGKQTWMAENLNYTPSSGNSWCYDKSVNNCTKYGRLYDWNTALTACPAGWHIPTVQDWEDLGAATGGKRSTSVDCDQEIVTWSGAGTMLKSKTGWKDNGSGTDDYGFSALPGGTFGVDQAFDEAGAFGYWWTATEERGNQAHIRRMNRHDGNVDGYHESTTFGYSVRCVQN
jgi:uncharacterized protein (TIGR02145 family)